MATTKKTTTKKTTTKTAKGPLSVVRTYSAGVHVGRVVSRTDGTITLADARRLWRWRGANTLHEVATKGVAQEYTRLSEPVPTIDLAEWIEVIPVQPAAVASLTSSRWGA